jgi:hypothetical protein
MTRKQIYNQIAAFTGDWKSARRKAEIFDHNCLVVLAQVKNLKLSFGRRLNDADHYIEDRDTLHFRYTTKQGEEYHFSILD